MHHKKDQVKGGKLAKVNDDNCFILHPFRKTPFGQFYHALACVHCNKSVGKESRYIFYRGKNKWNKKFSWTERVCALCFKKAKKDRYPFAKETWRME